MHGDVTTRSPTRKVCKQSSAANSCLVIKGLEHVGAVYQSD